MKNITDNLSESLRAALPILQAATLQYPDAKAIRDRAAAALVAHDAKRRRAQRRRDIATIRQCADNVIHWRIMQSYNGNVASPGVDKYCHSWAETARQVAINMGDRA